MIRTHARCSDHLPDLRVPRAAAQALGTHLRYAVLSAALLALPTCVACSRGTGSAAETPGSTVEKDQQALRTARAAPWLDAEQMALQPPQPLTDPDHPLRTQGRVAPPPTGPAPAPAAGGGGGGLPGAQNAGYLLMAVLGIAAVVLFLALGILAFLRGNPIPRKRTTNTPQIEIDPARIEDLPMDALAVSHDPLAQARQLYLAGQYEQATLYLYCYMLLALDREARIQLHRSKTNRMYLAELRSLPPLRAIVEAAMIAFEDVYFGRHRITRERFETSWNEVDRFHQLARQAPLAADVHPAPSPEARAS
jgi:hypothetical protein